MPPPASRGRGWPPAPCSSTTTRSAIRPSRGRSCSRCASCATPWASCGWSGWLSGRDGRNRCLLSAFSSRTGRNQPSNAKFLFGPATWVRSLIRPERGRALAYVDFSSQEMGIAAALSGDARLLDAYRSGDVYLAFAKQAGLAPADATKASHGEVRDRCKAVVLGTLYGMGPETLARRIGRPLIEARDLLRLHQTTYRRFWEWSDSVVSSAVLTGGISTVFGWRLNVGADFNPRSLMNFPMQANGAEMLRLACCLADEFGPF